MTQQTRFAGSATLLALLAMTAACGPRLAPVMENGQIVPDRGDEIVARAAADGAAERERLRDARAAVGADALAQCAPAICEAVTRGELAIGMNEAQVLAATRTTYDAWDARDSGAVTLMTGLAAGSAPRDAIAEIALVTLEGGRVTGYTYREAHGFRTVSTPADATLAGRAAARADALLAQGDEYAAAGRLDLALERYDRADVIRPGHSDTNLRIASTLDKQLRPIEALMRYKLFIHQMELEKIEARGEVAAKIAEAIARARERVVILEQR